MMRYLKILFLSTVVFGLMVGGAWAGEITTAITAGNDLPATPVVYAQEMVNATLTTQVPGNAISHELTGTEALAAATPYTMRFDLSSGATFASTNGNYTLLAVGALTIPVAATRTGGGQGSSFIEFSFTTGVAGIANDNITLGNIDPGGLRINNAPLAVAGTSITVTSTIRTIGNVLMSSASLAFMNSTWGFEVVTNSPVNGNGWAEVIAATSGRKQFRVGGVLQTWVNDATILMRTTGAVQGDGGTAFLLVAADQITLTITGDMTGVTKVWFDTNVNGVFDAGELAATVSGTTSGTATFSNISGTNALVGVARNLGVTVDGTTVLENRIWRLAASLNMSDAAFNDHTNMTIRRTATVIALGVVTLGVAADGIYNWAHDGYMAIVPWMVNATSVPTYCLINNADTVTGGVYLDVLASEGAVVISNASLGDIAARTSNMATFTSNSASLAGGTAVSLSTLGADKRYNARITVTVGAANVTITCIQTDPLTGAKRAVPALSGAGAVWFQ